MLSKTTPISALTCTTLTPTIHVYHQPQDDAQDLVQALLVLQQCAPKAMHTLAECLLQHANSLEHATRSHATSHAIRSMYDVCRLLQNT